MIDCMTYVGTREFVVQEDAIHPKRTCIYGMYEQTVDDPICRSKRFHAIKINTHTF